MCMKFVSAKYTQHLWNWAHADLEALEDLNSQFNEENQELIASQFSALLQDVRISDVTKFTFPGRLKSSQSRICEYLNANPVSDEIKILDVGASDGITTQELSIALSDSGMSNFKITIGELNPFLERFRKLGVTEYRAPNGDPVQLRIGMLAWRLPTPDKRSAVLSRLFISQYLKLNQFRKALVNQGKIWLISPVVRHNSKIEIKQMDCFQYNSVFANSFNVIRASNILNLTYFGSKKIGQALKNLTKYLKDGGILLVSRNADETPSIENGSIFKKESNLLKRVADFGDGSEVASLISETTSS